MTCRVFRRQLNPGRPARQFIVAAVIIVGLSISACGNPLYRGQQQSVGYRSTDTEIPEELRSSIRLVMVKPSEAPPSLSIDGDFGQPTATAGEGAAAGASAGAEAIGEDPRILILAPIIIPVALIAGSIGGAAAAKIKEQVQEFRDDLTNEFVENGNRPLPTNDLAEDLLAYLQNSSNVDATLYSAQAPTPTDIDAILNVEVRSLTVRVDGGNATMTTTATANLRRVGDTSIAFYKSYRFVDTNSLRNWTRNENALWQNYVERARRYFSRIVSDDFFEKIILRHVLRPVRTSSYRLRGVWTATVKSPNPTLAWELFLLGGDEDNTWTEQIDETQITYDLEIFAGNRMIHSKDNISTTTYDVPVSFADCSIYSWSVRPVYRIGDKTRTGEWMKRLFRNSASSHTTYESNSDTPDITLGYPQFQTRCR